MRERISALTDALRRRFLSYAARPAGDERDPRLFIVLIILLVLGVAFFAGGGGGLFTAFWVILIPVVLAMTPVQLLADRSNFLSGILLGFLEVLTDAFISIFISTLLLAWIDFLAAPEKGPPDVARAFVLSVCLAGLFKTLGFWRDSLKKRRQEKRNRRGP